MPFPVGKSGLFISLFNFYVRARNKSGVLGNFIGMIGQVTRFMGNGQNLLRSGTFSVKNKRIVPGKIEVQPLPGILCT